MTYSINKETACSFDEALTKAKNALTQEGFGVLTEIDVQATLKKKLDVDFDKYQILGACNPPLAHKALQAETEIGLMLPCNVIIYEKDNKTFISAIRPTIAMGVIDNVELLSIAQEVEEKLNRAIEAV